MRQAQSSHSTLTPIQTLRAQGSQVRLAHGCVRLAFGFGIAVLAARLILSHAMTGSQGGLCPVDKATARTRPALKTSPGFRYCDYCVS